MGEFNLCGGAITTIALLIAGLVVEHFVITRRQRKERDAIRESFERSRDEDRG